MLTYSATTRPDVRVGRVRFHVLSADQIRKASVVEVTEATLVVRGLPAPRGLSDARMGSVDRRLLCTTCGLDVLSCQGHPGHIELPYPMYHSIFFDTLLKTLRTQCFMCARVCVAGDDEAHALTHGLAGKPRLLSVYAAVRTRRRCPHCDAQRPTFVRQSMSVHVEWPEDAEWVDDAEREYCTRAFTAREALSMLRNMPDDDCRLLGFDPRVSHPANMVTQALQVPPPSARPTIHASEGSKTRGTDDLTQRLQDVLKRVHAVKAVLAAQHGGGGGGGGGGGQQTPSGTRREGGRAAATASGATSAAWTPTTTTTTTEAVPPPPARRPPARRPPARRASPRPVVAHRDVDARAGRPRPRLQYEVFALVSPIRGSAPSSGARAGGGGSGGGGVEEGGGGARGGRRRRGGASPPPPPPPPPRTRRPPPPPPPPPPPRRRRSASRTSTASRARRGASAAT